MAPIIMHCLHMTLMIMCASGLPELHAFSALHLLSSPHHPDRMESPWSNKTQLSERLNQKVSMKVYH